MPNTKLVPSSYRKLVSDIAALYEGVRRSLVEAGWKTGQWIVEVEQKGDVRATRGDQLLPKLSEDLTQILGSGFFVQSLRAYAPILSGQSQTLARERYNLGPAY